MMFTLLRISSEAWMAISGIGGLLVGGFVTIITTKLTSKSAKELAIITGQNSIELAKIAANQDRLELSHLEQVKVVEEYHKEVNGRMGELLQTTKALGAAQNQAVTDKKEQKDK